MWCCSRAVAVMLLCTGTTGRDLWNSAYLIFFLPRDLRINPGLAMFGWKSCNR